MIKIKLSDLYHFFNQKSSASIPLMSGNIAGVTIDSRCVKQGELFVAIVGDRFDGHDFVESAFEHGACAAIVSKAFAATHAFDKPLIAVDDTQIALRDMSERYRLSMSLPVVALTGSCGKTTTKEMIASVLRERYRVFVTPGNKNNHLGVPLSILQCTGEEEALVFELGANHVNEIRENVRLVKPHIALITNVGGAHVGEFGGVEAIFSAKSEIFEGLSPDGLAVYNADDAFAPAWKKLLAEPDKAHHTMTFGFNKEADVRAESIQYNQAMCASFQLKTPQGSISVQLSVAGEHNVRNALAAAIVGLAFEMPLESIAAGLAKCVSVDGRMNFKQGINGARLIDDTYNANLKSVEAAMQVLAGFAGKRILALGDICELGQWGIEHHQLIGTKADELGVDVLLTCGTLSAHASDAFSGVKAHFSNTKALAEKLKSLMDSQTTVVVKGSRSSHMEDVVSYVTSE